MVIPSIVVKVRRPTEEFNGSDSDFEVVSDSGNDNDSVIEGGYERLNEELVDAVVLHPNPDEILEDENVNQECLKETDEKIVVNLTPKQITGGEDRRKSLETRENRDKKSLSLVMLPKEMTLMDVAVPSTDEKTENFISRSVSSNFVDRINTVLARRNAVGEEIIKESLSNLNLAEDPVTFPVGRKMSDSVIVDYSKGLEIAPVEGLRKHSMPAVLPSAILKEQSEMKVDSPQSGTRWSFYKEVSSNAAIDRIRDESISSSPPKIMPSKRVDRQHSETINDLIMDKLKCYLCKAVYKDPRVLDCLHNFCYECLNQIDMNRNAAGNLLWNRCSSNGSELEFNCKYSYGQKLILKLLSGLINVQKTFLGSQN